MPHQSYIGSDGKPWPSATELTSLLPQPWLMSWFKDSVKKNGWRGWQRNLAQTKRGGAIGTEVHGLIEGFIKKDPFTISGKYESELYADKLFDAVNPLVQEYVSIEPHVKSETEKIHGTADMIVRLKGRPEYVVGDWKTSAAKSLTHPIQLAIYAMCWNQEHVDLGSLDQIVNIGFIARIDKKSKRLGVKIDYYENLAQYYPIVKALRLIWAYENEGV